MRAAVEQVKTFFEPDFESSPKYKQDPQSALKMLKIRADSRGQPIRRTFLGNTDSFYEAKKQRESEQEMIKKAAMPRH